MNRMLAISAAVASALYLLLANTLGYLDGAILKTSMCVLLASLAWRQREKLLAVALLFSAVGDGLLAIDGAGLFVPALASFLMTHLLYAALFVRLYKNAPFVLGAWRKAIMLLPIVIAVGYSTILWPNLGALTIPVLLYICAIVAMTVLSFRVHTIVVPIGALLFMTSDSLIAYERFIQHAPWLGPAVWITYAVAQQLIVYGLANPFQQSTGSPRQGIKM
jgi:uncharacterized membrane protein YhhN